MPKLEIACFSALSALKAYASNTAGNAAGGADRIELCAEGSAGNGGTTPSVETFASVIRALNQHHHSAVSSSSSEDVHSPSPSPSPSPVERIIPINIMIRPRGGDFVYSDAEFEAMQDSIRTFKTLHRHHQSMIPLEEDGNASGPFGAVDGFVFGILTASHTVDVARNAALVRLAAPLPCTFHRAMDQVLHHQQDRGYGVGGAGVEVQALEDVQAAGFRAVLTSGGAETAAAGAARIATLVRAAAESQRIDVIVGGGVRRGNVKSLRDRTGARWFHSSAIVAANGGDEASVEEIRELKKELQLS